MTLPEEIGGFIDPILWAFHERLETTIRNRLIIAYLRGAAETTSYGRTIIADHPIFYEGPPMTQATEYASKRTAEMVTKMDNETKDRLRDTITKAVKEKRGAEGLARDVRSQFGDMSKYRSETIARTETADALEQSFMDRSHDLGVDGKEVVTNDPCEICQGNEAVGVIPIDDVFPSGEDRPPFHPNCMCALAPVMI